MSMLQLKSINITITPFQIGDDRQKMSLTDHLWNLSREKVQTDDQRASVKFDLILSKCTPVWCNLSITQKPVFTKHILKKQITSTIIPLKLPFFFTLTQWCQSFLTLKQIRVYLRALYYKLRPWCGHEPWVVQPNSDFSFSDCFILRSFRGLKSWNYLVFDQEKAKIGEKSEKNYYFVQQKWLFFFLSTFNHLVTPQIYLETPSWTPSLGTTA